MLSFVLVIVFRLLSSAQGQTSPGSQCYWPDGSEADGLVPCPQLQLGEDAPCCWDGDYCTSDSYCVTAYYRYFYRGACTAQGWGNATVEACPQTQCFQTANFRAHAVAVVACNDTAFACGEVGDAARYCEEGPVFTMGAPTAGLEFYTLEAGAELTPGPSDSTSPLASPSSLSGGEKSDTPAIIGLATALGVLALVTVILGVFLWRNIRESKKQRNILVPTNQIAAVPGAIPALEADGGISSFLGRPWEGGVGWNSGHHGVAELSATRPPQEMMVTK